MMIQNKLHLAAAAATLCTVLLILSGCSNAVSASSIKSSRFAIVIGINAYPGNELYGCENDATAMHALLEKKGWTVVTELLSAAATKSAIKDAIQGLANQSGFSESSSICIFYSGHGSYSNDGEAYIVPVDFDFISATELKTWLDTLSCANKLLLFDSCFSGGFVQLGASVDASPQAAEETQGADLAHYSVALKNFGTLIASSASGTPDPGVMMISAAGSKEYSWDSEIDGVPHGAFTGYLLKSVDAADTDGDGYVTMTEAYTYAKQGEKAWFEEANAAGYSIYVLPHLSGGSGEIVLFDNN